MAMPNISRSLARVVSLPPAAPGQFGEDHTVVEVIKPQGWAEQDPFILLMDDRVDGSLRAGPHPHAGFETVTFPVEGGMESEGGAGRLHPGDVEWTTAGSGIVHGPDRPVSGRFRILQLWLALPAAQRWTEPDNQIISGDSVPVRHEPGATVRLYSGVTGELSSPTRNRVPVTLVDVRLEPGARVEQELPSDYNGFLYVLEGEARIGAEGTPLGLSEVGWLDRPSLGGSGTLTIMNDGPTPLRLLLYAGQRQNIPIVSYGPFIGGSKEDIMQSIDRYQTGSFRRY
ncbi:MAG: pirin family protein [Polyangiaceae bacterium]|jgi:redox-sensitive bicupin YhaK (pirin superfamily)|nr:pirin family protein [Polyangiaceae bacterium]